MCTKIFPTFLRLDLIGPKKLICERDQRGPLNKPIKFKVGNNGEKFRGTHNITLNLKNNNIILWKTHVSIYAWHNINILFIPTTKMAMTECAMRKTPVFFSHN